MEKHIYKSSITIYYYITKIEKEYGSNVKDKILLILPKS